MNPRSPVYVRGALTTALLQFWCSKRDSDLDELHKDGAFFYMADDCFSSAIGTSSGDYCGYQALAGVRKRLAVAVVGCAHVWVQQGAARAEACCHAAKHSEALAVLGDAKTRA